MVWSAAVIVKPFGTRAVGSRDRRGQGQRTAPAQKLYG
jgi:hypothetical protein